MKRSPLLLLVVLFVGSSVACMTSADVDADNIEITRQGLRFDGATAATLDGTIAIEGRFDLDASTLSWAKNLNPVVRVKAVRLTATEGRDLGFLEFVTATLSSAKDPGHAVPVASYQRSAVEVPSVQIGISNPQPIDVTSVWAAQRLQVAIMLAGKLPSESWSVDVAIVLDGEFKLLP